MLCACLTHDPVAAGMYLSHMPRMSRVPARAWQMLACVWHHGWTGLIQNAGCRARRGRTACSHAAATPVPSPKSGASCTSRTRHQCQVRCHGRAQHKHTKARPSHVKQLKSDDRCPAGPPQLGAMQLPCSSLHPAMHGCRELRLHTCAWLGLHIALLPACPCCRRATQPSPWSSRPHQAAPWRRCSPAAARSSSSPSRRCIPPPACSTWRCRPARARAAQRGAPRHRSLQLASGCELRVRCVG